MRIADSEGVDLSGFHPLAQIESEREVAVRVVARQRHVLEIVERFGSQLWIGEHGPVFLPAIELSLGSLMHCKTARRIAVVGAGSWSAEIGNCRRQDRDPACTPSAY